jgi:hypothetical protein
MSLDRKTYGLKVKIIQDAIAYNIFVKQYSIKNYFYFENNFQQKTEQQQTNKQKEIIVAKKSEQLPPKFKNQS